VSSGETSAPALAGGQAGALEAQVEQLRRVADVPAAATSATDAAAAAEG